MKLTDVIRRPLITEKTSIQREDGRTLVFRNAGGDYIRGNLYGDSPGIYVVPADGGDAVVPIESAIPPLLEGAREVVRVSASKRRSYYSLLLHTDREWIDSAPVGSSGSGSDRASTFSCRNASSSVSLLWANTPSTHS